MTYVLFDIGGTKTRVGLTDDLKTIYGIDSFNTPVNAKEGISKIIGIAQENAKDDLEGMAGGVRGLLNEEKTGIENDLVLTKWAGKSIVDEIKKLANIPCFIENDAAIAGLGEAVFGAGKGLDIVAYHTVSTGVGGARIENGEIDESSAGFEPGHQILDIDRTILGDEIEPTLENLVSGTALADRFGVPAYEISQDDVVWDELAEYLAQGLRNTIMYWSPDVIVLGGSMIVGDPAIPVDVVRKYVVESLDGFVESPHITKAKLGNEAGLYGAMAILKNNL